ncbi:hypothetical protein [Psychrosphaera aestuarii]|uniref:hypothetical protein n=1 Tax=Psychrosphaera aestuarii TaxID=1266052 RepID=UPI001B321AFD|nr:hypothetical protein [Psychrosphaera aestuarii]
MLNRLMLLCILMICSPAQAEWEPITSEAIGYIEKFIELDKNRKNCQNYKYKVVPIHQEKTISGSNATLKMEFLIEESFEPFASYRIWKFQTLNGKPNTEMTLIADFDAWKEGIDEVCKSHNKRLNTDNV